MRKRVAKKILKNRDKLNYKPNQINEAEKIMKKFETKAEKK